MTRTLSVQQLREAGCSESICSNLLALLGPGDIPVTPSNCLRVAHLVGWSPYGCLTFPRLLGYEAPRWDRYVVLCAEASVVFRNCMSAAYTTHRLHYVAELDDIFSNKGYTVARVDELAIRRERRIEKYLAQCRQARSGLREACALAFYEAFNMGEDNAK